MQALCQAAQANAEPKLAKEPAKPAQLTAFYGGLGLPSQKNKINWRFVDSFDVHLKEKFKQNLGVEELIPSC